MVLGFLLGLLSLLLQLLSLVVASLLVIVLAKRYMQTRITVILLLLISYLIDVPHTLLDLWGIVNNLDNVSQYFIDSSDNIWFSLTGIASAGFFLLFVDYFENERFSLWKTGSFIFAFSFYGAYALFLEVLRDVPNYEDLYYTLSIFSIFPAIFLPYVAIITFLVLRRIKRRAFDKTQTRQILLMQTAVLLYFLIVPLIAFVQNSLMFLGTEDEFLVVMFWHTFYVVVIRTGDLLIFFSYAMSSRVAYLQPQQMYKLIVVSNAGLPIFEYTFRDIQSDSALFSGGVTAITSLLAESIGKSVDIDSMSFDDGTKVLVANKNNFGSFLVVERPSSFLKSALQTFTNDFEREYGDLGFDIINDKTFAPARTIVERNFGLVEQ